LAETGEFRQFRNPLPPPTLLRGRYHCALLPPGLALIGRGGGFTVFNDRRSLPLLLLIAAVPLFLFVALGVAFDARSRQQAVERNAMADAHLLMAKSDGLLREALAASEALASSATLRDRDVGIARTRAEQFRINNPDWVEVALDDNQSQSRIFDLGVPRAPGPFLGAGEMRLSLRREGGCNCIVISHGFTAETGRARTLHVALSNASFYGLMPRAYGDYEVAALVDDRGHFVARSINDDGKFATPGSIDLRRASASSDKEGMYRGTTLEGTRNYTAFARSGVNGWSAHIAMKAQRIDNPALAFWLSIGLAVLLTLGLAVLLYAVAKRQIDDRHAITERMQEAQKLEALGQLTGGMAHDFNNLLTPIVAALDRLARSDNLDAREKRFATGALQSAERAATLTSQLLSFSRRQKLAIAPVDLKAVIRDVGDLAGQSLEVRHPLECAVDPGTPRVSSDKVQLELAILNLILNSRDAMPGGGAIEVTANPFDDNGTPSAAITVADKGAGMDAATARKALEPFFTTKPQGAGTGLGLAQVAEVARQSNGRLTIDSRPGEGTRVSIILPAVAAPEAAPAPTYRARDLPGALQLLIVDDNADVRETLVQMVEADGHRVESVADGRTALSALSNRRPDMLLVDFAMPGLNGAELIAEAHKVHPGIPCLLITGYWDSDALANYGVTCPVLKKPFTHEALREAMAEALTV
jgi:signal transduction histidine kinase